MIGAAGPRCSRRARSRVDAWNAWYDGYGNTPEGFAALSGEVTRAAERAGRDPADIARSACVLVALEPLAGLRHAEESAAPVEGDARRIAEHLRALAAAGADEAILGRSPDRGALDRAARRRARAAGRARAQAKGRIGSLPSQASDAA